MSLFKNFGVLLLTLLTGVLFIASPAFADAPFSDNFESYTVDQPLVGQGLWQGAFGAFQVVNASSWNGTTCAGGSQCLLAYPSLKTAFRMGDSVLNGSWDTQLKVAHGPSARAGYVSLGTPDSGSDVADIFPGSLPDTFALRDNRSNLLVDNISAGSWHTLTLSWTMATSGCHFFVDVDHSNHPAEAMFYAGYGSYAETCWPSAGYSRALDEGGINTLTLAPLDDTSLWYVDDIGATPAGSPSLGNLEQYQGDGTTPITWGAGFVGNSVVLKADVADTGTSNVTLQVEVKPVNDMFDGTNLYSTTTNSSAAASLATTTLAVTINNLFAPTSTVPINGITSYYHWRARVIDSTDASSSWATFSSLGIGTDFSAHYTLGQAAADLAVIAARDKDPYLGDGETWGGKGWDPYQRNGKGVYVTPAELKNYQLYPGEGYHYWNYVTKTVEFGSGVDCSGLVDWTYNRSFDPTLAFINNAIRYEGANGQYHQNVTSTTRDDLQPGDLLYFGTTSPTVATSTHVAMYVGPFRMNNKNFDVVEAFSPVAGIIPSTVDAEIAPNLLGFRKVVVAPVIGGRLQAGSPIDLTLTDPDGYTISATTSIQVDGELLHEVANQLYYSDSILGSDGHPEAMIYWPTPKTGAYKIKVTPMAGTTPNQTYSLTFTSGSSTIVLAQDVPLSQIPQNGYNVAVMPSGTAILDTVPPEANISFSTSTKTIAITGTDNLSTTTVTASGPDTIIGDAAGNTLTLANAKILMKPNYTALTIPSFAYSTGTTTNATTTLRYFWLTDKTGKYTLLIAAIKTPTDRLVSIYSALFNQTFVVSSSPSDDTDDLSLKTALLLLRPKLKTYKGMYIPGIVTHSGAVVIQ